MKIIDLLDLSKIQLKDVVVFQSGVFYPIVELPDQKKFIRDNGDNQIRIIVKKQKKLIMVV